MVKVTREDAITGGDMKCKNGWWFVLVLEFRVYVVRVKAERFSGH
jgi:nitrogen fixation protein